MKNLSSREESIYKYIEKITLERIQTKNFEYLNTDAQTISIDLHLDRANVSRILNNLFRKNLLVKIQGRPTYYLGREGLATNFPDKYIPSVITKEDKVENYIHAKSPLQRDGQKNPLYHFEDVIGLSKNESIHVEMNKAQIFASYPNHLYNCLIDGCSSTGKKYVSNAINQFGVSIGKYSDRTIEIDCRLALSYKESIEKIISSLKDNHSLDDKITLVMIKNIDFVPMELFDDFIETIISYQKNNTNEKYQLLFLTHQKLNPEKRALLESHISMGIALPDLKNRTLKETVEFILLYFQTEANQINKTVGLSKDVLSCLAMAKYEDNLIGLQNEIRFAISNAYYDYITKRKPTIELNLQDLSDKVLNSITGINNRLEDFENICAIIEPFNLYFIPNITCESLNKLHSSVVNDEGKVSDDKNIPIPLSSLCKNEIKKYETTRLTTMKSIQVSSIYECAFPLIEESDVTLNDKILYPFYVHLKNSISDIQNGVYKQQYIDDHQFIAPSVIILGQKIASTIEKKFKITLPPIERKYINTYLSIAQTYIDEGTIPIVIISSGEDIADSYVRYIKSLNFKVRAHALNYTKEFQSSHFSSFLQYIIRTVQQVNQGKGVVIISDLNQMVDLNHYIFEETAIPCVSITPVSLNSVLHIVEIAEKKESSIDDFKDISTLLLHDSMNDSANLVGFSNYFLFEFSQKVLSQSLLFLDVNRSTRALTSALANIYKDLEMDYSDEITIRFLHHCSFMIERVIKNEALTFKNTKKIVESNKRIYQSIERNLTPVGQQFGVTFPPNELAMVSIIFLDVQAYEE